MIDLRSDTVTLPTPAMREAIARADLGDDVYGEDPTVNQLEKKAAAMMDKEAAMLVPSGTMANLIAFLVHCPRGGKAIVGARSHTWLYEAGGASALGAIVLAPVRNTGEGLLDLGELAAEVDTAADPHFAQPCLVALENTHNRCGGTSVPISHMAEVRAVARRRDLPVHLDGARIFNAALALEATAASIAAQADTVSFCLSKGLACPVGSLLCGGGEFIEKARRVRKMLGGGMRQAGIIAAAGIVALDTMIARLAEDHENAASLAAAIADVPGIKTKPEPKRTNMVFFDVVGEANRAGRFERALERRGVLIASRGGGAFRAVTHYGITRGDALRAADAIGKAAHETLNP